jgi:hypothetical protein
MVTAGARGVVPPASHPTWKRLIKGEADHRFGVASAGLLFFRLREQYKQTPAQLESLIKEARRFFERYEAILEQDIRVLFR